MAVKREQSPQFRQAQNAAGKKYREKIRDQVFSLLGEKCTNCGFSDRRALQVDHKFRAKEPRQSYKRSGIGLYKDIVFGRKPFSEFQLLCANCNWIKRAENQEYGVVGKRWYES